jgi:hypothetical protein
MSCSGISIGFPLRKDVRTPRLVTGAEGSGPASCDPLSSCSSDRLPFFERDIYVNNGYMYRTRMAQLLK